MSTFTEEQFEKKLLALKDTHESISRLSAWCLDHPQQHKKIVSIWLQVLKKVSIEQRLTLFYLANDVIQYSKRKNLNFVESWGTALQKATTMVRDDKVKNKILRLFKIWDDRSIYDEAFLVDLSGLLSSRKPAQNNQEAQDFQPASLISKVRSCKSLEDDTDSKRKIVNDSHLSLNDAEALHSSLKDRRHGADLEQELEEGVEKMVTFISALKSEITERTSLIEMLDQAETFYENQKRDAKIVCNAYKTFYNRVENLRKKLDGLRQTLPSPIPSPDINAPSPSPESDIDLPDDNLPEKYSAATSFIGTMVVPENLQLSNPSDQVYPVDKSPPRKFGYKPPTPPRSFKRKLSPKSHHSPVTTYISSSVTPTLSSSSASNYSSNSPYLPVIKPVSCTTNYSYTHENNSSYNSATTYQATSEFDPSMYNPEEEDQSMPYTTPSPESYHIPGSNPPPPTASYINPPPPALARNQSPPHSMYSSTNLAYQPPVADEYHNPPPPNVPPPDYFIPPPTNEYKPFYSSSANLTMPPLLGEDCPPTSTNGLDLFLQGESSKTEEGPPLLGSGFSSFMGNINLPFDFQKGLFTETSCAETPASPPPQLDDSTSQNYFSDPNNDVEGKPIEVINRTKQPDLSDILKAITMKGLPKGLNLTAPPSVIPPPPLPPPVMEESSDKVWNQPPLLPPKFPTWGQDNWADTPASPPLYEKTGSFEETVEFEDSDSVADTDMRSLGLQSHVDIDHRNLISLTSSPRDSDNTWNSNQDTDYRKLALGPKKVTPDDNVESVDMEMSSEEENEGEVTKPSVSFSLSSHSKPLAKSPLVEKEEPKVKRPLNVNISPPLPEKPSEELVNIMTPPPRLPEPPPLPNVDDIFPDLDSGGENVEEPGSIPAPPIPPPLPPMPMQQLRPVQERPMHGPNFLPNQRPQRFFGPRFNNQRQRFPSWQNNNNNMMRPRQPPLPQTGPRLRHDGNFRGRPNRGFRGHPRPPRFSGW